MTLWVRLVLAMFVCCPPRFAAAHDLALSVLRVRELGDGEFLTHFEQVQGLRDPEQAYLLLRPSFPDHCTFIAPRLSCGERGLSGTMGFAGIGDLSASGAVMRVEWSGTPSETFAFTAERSRRVIQRPESAPHASSHRYVKEFTLLGVEHILFGWDHILFVLGLLWLVRTPIMLLKTISAFTLAHSVTLFIATVHVFTLPPAPVEAVIALSIVLVSLEVVRSRRDPNSSLTARAPGLVALLFGLLHGFGFASALARIELPRDQLLPALFFFNVGVELGQVAFVGSVLALDAVGRRVARATTARVAELAPYGAGGVAMYWFAERVLAFGF